MDKVNAWPAQSTTTLSKWLGFINVMEFKIQHVLFVGVKGGYVMTQHEVLSSIRSDVLKTHKT